MERSTESTNRKEAQKIAEAWEDAYRKRRTAPKFRRVLSEGHREITGEDVSHTTIRTFVDSWVEAKKPEIAPSTLTFYKKSAEKFLNFLGDAADRDLGEVTREDITRFRNEEANRFAPRTANHEVKFLRMFTVSPHCASAIAKACRSNKQAEARLVPQARSRQQAHARFLLRFLLALGDEKSHNHLRSYPTKLDPLLS